MTIARHFALVPAAGTSSRMGEPKLLLPLAGKPLIQHTIEAWQRSRVNRIIVVVRPDDKALATLIRDSGQSRVDLVIPDEPPPDMKASLQAALKHIEQTYAPSSIDAFLVAPADMPRLSTAIVNRLIDRHIQAAPAAILAPTLAGTRGHPVLFPWPFATQVHALAPNTGLNAIVDHHQPLLLPCEDIAPPNEYPFTDIDTPDDFQKLSR